MNNKRLIVEDTLRFAVGYHGSDPSGHDKEHILRVYKNALKILKSYLDADDFIVKMSSLLHDVDDYKINPKGGVALRWLKDKGVDKNISDRIIFITENIGYSKTGDNPVFEDIETKIVYDADKLDAIGAIAVARVFAYGGLHGRPIFDSEIFPKNKLSRVEYKSNNSTGFNHFFEKLLKLKNLLQTDVARKEGAKRHRFMVKYLEQFIKEQGNKEWHKYFRKFVANI